MIKRMICFIVVLALAASSYGIAPELPLLVGDWESNFDHWRSGWGGAFSFDPAGATLNDSSLKWEVGAGGWNSALALKLQGFTNLDVDIWGPMESLVPWLVSEAGPTTFEVDMTRLEAEWVEDFSDPTAVQTSFIKLVFNAGGQDADGEYGPGVWYDCGDLGNWDSWTGDSTMHLVWDITGGIAQFKTDILDAGFDQGDVYAELFLVSQNSGYVGPLTYYFDNAQLTPEPATIALLGLGGLALLRIRKKG